MEYAIFDFIKATGKKLLPKARFWRWNKIRFSMEMLKYTLKNPDFKKYSALRDNGGRRFGFDRRRYCYSFYMPERRSGIDLRNGTDRRKSIRLKANL